MFKTLKTIIAPKSFDLPNFLSKSKRYQKVNSTLKKQIEKHIALQPSKYLRSGELANATLCGSSILTLTDENLAKALYIAINSKTFWEKIESLRFTHEDILFKDLKFFVDEKQKKVLYMSYLSSRNITCDFFECAFKKLNALKDHLSLSSYGFDLDYKKFFTYYYCEYSSFLTSFFVSLVPGCYDFHYENLLKIASLFYETNKSLDMTTPKGLSGIYLHDFHYCFPSFIPRNLRINILKLLTNNTSFNSYEEFFSSYPNNGVDSFLNLEDTFVFDENLLTSWWNKFDENDNMVTYTKPYTSTLYVIVKFKEATMFSKYANILMDNMHMFEYMAGAANSDFTAFYLVFRCNHTKKLRDIIKNPGLNGLESIIELVNSTRFNIPFKENTSMVDCFTANDSSLYLLPTALSFIDFSDNSYMDYHLLTMQIIKAYVEAKKIDANNLYEYHFMKLFSYSFVQKLINYLNTGVYDKHESKSQVELILPEYLEKIKFLNEVSSADSASFLAEATTLTKVQELILARDSAVSADCFNASYNCFSDLILLSNSTLSELFDDSNPEFQYITDVIVSEEFVKDGEYAILGVIWKYPNLRTINSVIREGINSKQLYTMICSLTTKEYAYLNHLVEPTDIGNFLVDKDFNVYINPNVLKLSGRHDRVAKKTRHRKHYYNEVVNAFLLLIKDMGIDLPFNSFDFDELLSIFDMSIVSSLQLCEEHGHYHLPNILCPKCQKIYEQVERQSWYDIVERFAQLPLAYFNPQNPTDPFKLASFSKEMFSEASFTKLISEVKIGLENNLYDDYFFRPLKIALETEPFGILFKNIPLRYGNLLPLDALKNTRRLKIVLVLYKKLLPKILSGQFITHNTEIFESIHLHKKYPGEIIILDLPLLECSAIIQENNEDRILKTKQLFAKFLIDYITNHSNSKEFEESNLGHLIQDIRSLNFSEQAVKDCIETFCVVHNTPSLRNQNVCPICKANGILHEHVNAIPETYFKGLEESEATYEGGEANLYPDGTRCVTKLFKGNVDLTLKSKIIGKALSISSKLKEFNQTHADIQFVTINKVLYSVSANGIKLKGYSLNFVDDSFKISRLKDKDFVEQQGYSRIDVLNILKKVCIGIEFLHSLGVYIGDLNGGNILIKDKTVYFIDIDGMSFGDVKNFIYTDTYIYPPSAANHNITMEDDWYSLAIQAFYYLTYSHPFRGVCENENVSSNIVERMSQGHSVLGNYGITPPSISIGWDFMPDYLVEFFRQTFEGTRRESMTSVLEAFIAELNSPNGFVKANRSFECKLAISEKIYLSTADEIICNENVIIPEGHHPTFVKNCGNYFIFTTDSQTLVVDEHTEKVFKFSQLVNSQKCFALANKLFYLSDNDTTLNVASISRSSGTTRVLTITRATNQKIVDLFVTDDLKFIFLEEEDENHYAIYCNSEKLTSIDISRFDNSHISSSILYDKLSGKYLVVLSGNSETLTITINPDGSYTTTTLPIKVSKSKCYYGNALYFVTNGQIEFTHLNYSKKGRILLDSVTCDSLIYHRGDKFIVCSEGETYIRLKP